MAGMGAKRLQKELQRLNGELPSGISLVSAPDLREWEMDMTIPDNPIYNPEEKYRLRITFSQAYPIEAPEVVFVASSERKIPMHPHVCKWIDGQGEKKYRTRGRLDEGLRHLWSPRRDVLQAMKTPATS